MVRKVINGAVWGVARTITARYFKNSVANFLRHDGMGNTGVMVIYDSENRQRQVDALRIGWWGGLDDKDQQPQGTEHSGTERRPWRNGSDGDIWEER